MKKILSLLVVFVFMQVQTWALSGGPQYGGNQAALTGTYAGVFTGISGTATNNGVNPLIDTTGSNSIGLFVVGVPTTDIALGTMAIFAEGTFYQGGILAVADPNKQSLTGICQGIHITTLTQLTDLFFTGTTSKTVNYDSRADGTIKTKISGGTTFGTTIGGTGNFSVSNIVTTIVTIPDPANPGRFTNAPVQTDVPVGTISFIVDGFKQSQTVVSPKSDSIANLLNGGGNAPGT